jgi:hypothetical protein
MSELIPGATLLMVKGGSHTAPLESPEAIGHAVEVFLMPLVKPAAAKKTPGKARPKRSAGSAGSK